MSGKPNYFKIGLFVLVAIGILIFGIILLSAGALRRKQIILETYFNESVVGLEIGSDVKYRGVSVGKVERIALPGQVYLTRREVMSQDVRYVIVYISLEPAVFEDMSYEQIQEFIRSNVERGMRIRLASLGITGLAYLEIDFLDPATNPPLPLTWTPSNYYLPSAPSVYTTLLDSLNQILTSVNGVLKEVEQIRIKLLAENVNDFLTALTSQIQDVNVGEISENILELVQDLNRSNTRLQEILDNPNIDQTLADAGGITSGAQRLVREDLTAVLNDLKSSTAGIRETVERLPETVGQLNLTLSRVQRLLAEQEQSIDLTLKNLELFTHNLIELSRNANKYPAHILFGDPPRPPELQE